MRGGLGIGASLREGRVQIRDGAAGVDQTDA